MNSQLARLIANYQTSVRTSVELMQVSGIARPATSMDWVANDIPQRGELSGGVKYFKHGYGCAVHLPSGTVDFDFGPHGEIDGFDAWRLIGFADEKLTDYGFADEETLKACFAAEVAAGALEYSGYILYYLKVTSGLPPTSDDFPVVQT
ncbi:hypothetical protein [Pseudomonas sp. Irchel 3A5]|uniref:DUF6896 domain-containing protein n=1 Tax=Pseudomonas sp. Irchel 3A5 TaxID=2008911 RepID=UPI000BA4CB30|nr:hypothetical protein [Pseudomonas sp. Irchel 3A5]